MSTSWLNFIKDQIFNVLQNTMISLVQLMFCTVTALIIIPQMFSHSARVCWCSPSTHSTSKAVDAGYSPESHSQSVAQSGSWHRWLPEQQNLSPHCLKLFKTDTAITCFFQVIFNFKAYKIFKSEPQNYIKEHYTRRHLPNKGTTINNPAPYWRFTNNPGCSIMKKISKTSLYG